MPKASMTRCILAAALPVLGVAQMETCMDVKTQYQKQGCCGSPAKTFNMPDMKTDGPDMWTFTVSMVMNDGCRAMTYNRSVPLFYHFHEVLTRPIGECTTNVLGSSVKFTCEGDHINEHVYIDATAGAVPKVPNCSGNVMYIMPIRNTCNKYSWGSMLATWQGYCMKPKIPQCITDFYDKILSSPGTHGQNQTLIDHSVASDWNTRVNPLNFQDGTGPGPQGLKAIMGLWSVIMPNIYVSRMQTFVANDGKSWVVLSRFGATMTALPPGQTEYPFFPGVPADKITGKSFESLALDIQVVENGKIKRAWHLEDWAAAADQMVNGKGKPNLVNPMITSGDAVVAGTSLAALTAVPQCIVDFYDNILSNPGSHGQNQTLINQTMASDWKTRINPLNHSGGLGPGPVGLKAIMGLWSVMIPNIKITRMNTMLAGDRVVVLSRFAATMAGLPPGLSEYPFFPGVPAATITGKSFESMALDIQVIRDGKIKQTWHLEDWSAAADQMVNGKGAPSLTNPNQGF